MSNASVERHPDHDAQTGGDRAAWMTPVPPPHPAVASPSGQAALAPPPANNKRHVVRWVSLAEVALIVVVLTGNTTRSTLVLMTSAAAPPTVSTGAGPRDASVDVTDLRPVDPNGAGFRAITATVTNNGSKRSNYLITVTIESADTQTQIDTTTLRVYSLGPGEVTEATGSPRSGIVPADATLSLSDVTQHAA